MPGLVFPPLRRVGKEIRWAMRLKWIHRTTWMTAAIFLMSLPSLAQMEIGDDWKMTLSGDVGYNYNGSLNQGISNHSMGFTGDANLNGSFYNPNFLNFNVQPYYDRVQANSAFGALTNTKGVNSNVNLFSGSHFPGSVNYSKGVNAISQFGIPGSTVGLAQHGDFQGFGVSWSELLPNLPTLTASYGINNGSSSVYGLQEQNKQNDHTFSLLSTYHVAGFNLGGGYTHRNVNSLFSELLDGLEEPVHTHTGTNNYQVNAQHAFPMSGSYAMSFSRLTYNYDDHDSRILNTSGTSDTVNGSLSFRPFRKFTLSFLGDYYDSLLGSLPEPIENGSTIAASTSVGTFRSFLVGTDGNYQVLPNLNLHGLVNHQHQEFLGRSYGSTQVGGSVNYNLNKKLLGSLTFSVGMFDSANQEGNSGLGFFGNVNFDRKIRGWDVGANFSYSQNVQTLILVYTTSSMGYVTNVRRRLANRTFFMAGFSGSHSGITAQSGTSNSAERISSTFTYHGYSANGFYSKSSGTAAFTATGLVALPPGLPPTIFAPDAVIVYGSDAWGVNLSATPMRRLNVSAGYAKSKGSTVDPLLTAFNSNELYNVVMQYKLRKIFLNAGFTRLQQSIGTVGTPPFNVTAYYIGFSRWFNFF